MAGYYDPDGFWVNTDATDYSNEGRSYSTDQGEYQIDTQGSGGSPVNASMTNLSGLTGILGQFKGVFDRLKSGNTTTADVNAALGVLGLIMPSLTAPKTAGWRGSIDLNRQFTRTPTAPIAYTPYSGQPVMGRQYFTSAYGAPGAPAPTAPVPAPPPAPQEPPNYTESPGMAQGGIAMLAGGGEVNLRSGDFVFPADVTAFAGSGSNAAGKENLADAIGAIPIEITKGDGMSDDIPANIDGVRPAAVARDEMIVPRERVAEIGNGSLDRGAKKLYAMMDRIRQHATGSKDQIKPMEDIRQFTPGGIAGYAGGGAVAFNAGGTAGSAVSSAAPLGTSTETNISSWAGPYVGDMLSKTSALTNAPYQAWTGPLSAGYSPLQQQAFQGLSGLGTPSQFGTASQFATQAGQAAGGMGYTPSGGPSFGQVTSGYQAPSAYQAGQFANQFTAPGAYQAGQFDTGLGKVGSVQDYMSPYMTGVTDIASREARRQADITQQAQQAKLAQAGAFGGGRDAIMRAEMARNLGAQLEDITTKGLQSAYDRAMQQRMQEAQLGLTAQQAGEASRQFGAQQGMQGAQLGAQYGLAGQQASEASRQFGAQQGMTAAQQAAQFGLTAQQANQQAALEAARQAEQSRQFGANLGLQGLMQQLSAAQTLGGLGQQQFGTQLQGLQALLGAGTTQRGIEQEGITEARKQFETEQLKPYTDLRFQKEMLSGLPVATTQTTANTSTMGQFAGGFEQLAKALKELGIG